MIKPENRSLLCNKNKIKIFSTLHGLAHHNLSNIRNRNQRILSRVLECQPRRPNHPRLPRPESVC